MRYFLVVMFTLFFIGCYEEDIELDFCENHICNTDCLEWETAMEVYNDNELFMITCMRSCEASITYFKDDYSRLDMGTCTIDISDNNGVCEIKSSGGAYCDEFFNIYED